MKPLGDRKSTRLNSSHVEISYAVFCLIRRPPRSPPFPYTTLFRSTGTFTGELDLGGGQLVTATGSKPNGFIAVLSSQNGELLAHREIGDVQELAVLAREHGDEAVGRSEEHTSELQSRRDLVCRLLLDPPTTALSTLSLHDALPIYGHVHRRARPRWRATGDRHRFEAQRLHRRALEPERRAPGAPRDRRRPGARRSGSRARR